MEIDLSSCLTKPEACLYPGTLLFVSNFHVDSKSNMERKLQLFEAYSKHFLAMVFIATNPGDQSRREMLKSLNVNVLTTPTNPPPRNGFFDEFSFDEVADVLDIIQQNDTKYSAITSVLYIHADFALSPRFRFSSNRLSILPGWSIYRTDSVDRSIWHWSSYLSKSKIALAEIHDAVNPPLRASTKNVVMGWADVYSIPRAAFSTWSQLARIFARHGVINEVAVPTSSTYASVWAASRGICSSLRIETLTDVYGSCCTKIGDSELLAFKNRTLRSGHRLNLQNASHVGNFTLIWQNFSIVQRTNETAHDETSLFSGEYMKKVCDDSIFTKVFKLLKNKKK